MMGGMIRFIIIMFIVLVVLSVLRGMFSGSATVRTANPRTGRQRPGRSGKLVKDPVCGTYVPESTAIRLEGRETLFFCSEECRNRYPAATA